MILIFFSLILILIFGYISNEQDILSPSVLFTISFLFSSTWALIYASRWSLVPSISTIGVIVLGTLEFVIVATLVSKVMSNTISENRGLIWIKVSILKEIAIIFLEIVVILYVIKTIKSVTGIATLSDAIYMYRRVTVFSTQMSYDLPKTVFIGHNFCYASGFFFGYLLVKKLILLKKLDIPFLVIFILSAYESTLFGSRTGMAVLFLALIAYYFCLSRINKGNILKINPKYYVLGLVVLTTFLLSFKQLAVILGRDISTSAVDYLAEYSGAEIKNLDSFIRNSGFPLTSDIYHSQTVMSVSKLFGRIFDVGGLNYKLDLPFQSVNGFDLGNVYTMFYQFLYDLGYIGVLLFTLFMALFIQFIYSKTKQFKDNGTVSYSILLYGFFLNTLLLAFFSNKFYEQLANSSFVYIVIFWILLNWVMYGTKRRKNKRGIEKS